MIIPINIYQTNKILCYSSTKNVCKLKFADYLWLPFLDQPQYDIVVFEIINF